MLHEKFWKQKKQKAEKKKNEQKGRNTQIQIMFLEQNNSLFLSCRIHCLIKVSAHFSVHFSYIHKENVVNKKLSIRKYSYHYAWNRLNKLPDSCWWSSFTQKSTPLILQYHLLKLANILIVNPLSNLSSRNMRPRRFYW